MNFLDRVHAAMRKNNTLLCVGLDPAPERLPPHIRQEENPIFEFNKFIVDATADLVCAYKPQAAYFNGIGAEEELRLTIEYIKDNYPDIPVILDAKRGDIGSTADQYAREAFERYQADAITINPYMGPDTIDPFTKFQEKGTVILCRTSNPGAATIQNLKTESGYLYEVIAKKAASEWNTNHNVLLVVGATNPEELGRIRAITGDMTFLVPGLGAQGGDVEQSVKNGLNQYKEGMIINSSRGIIYAGNDEYFAEAAREAAISLRDQINRYR